MLFTVAVADIQITVVNQCSQTIWPGVWSQADIPENGGFELAAGAQQVLTVPTGWTAGRIWARTGCTGSGTSLTCETGACGNGLQCNGTTGATPASLAEITMTSTTGGNDVYDVSYVDGSNIPVVMQPVDGTFTPDSSQGQYYCAEAGACSQDLKTVVVAELQDNVNGQLVGSLSACLATGDAQYCCTGAYDTPETCPTSNFPPQYYSDLKAVCPTAYMYAYDDTTSTFSCKGSSNPSPDYTVTFCPGGVGL
ncbi:unnamed protein product [Bursaphelenchus okinawaensis]|uniref:Thaumatin-like protein n=1 Tax=Bursaphelenchus okinawaensis TaxID=465554 RepID=A0A811LJW2_9BILA|nr:unnamed protein product [Bursaphelenchus okinawaensis]CAD5228516.1 unnamed protein product [Bursaphelenchus okinawaensis]CAG9124594.1 unnamed protein product [Bursaphelenchus okinawaensis]CAG9124597.1 unnamed protein product [Bursaphelenchus okinawaensis]